MTALPLPLLATMTGGRTGPANAPRPADADRNERRRGLMGGKGSGAKPRKYPQDIVALACGLYRSGMTVAEIRAVFPGGYRVQTILERYLPERRAQAKRNQRGAANHMWRGKEAGYAALHLRVAAERGQPSECSWCGTTDGKFEWANLSGQYADINDYERLCIGCHRTYDAARRRETGRRTMPAKAVMPNV